MIMVLIAIGLPTNLFILIFPVDFMLDRLRTTVNVHGDSIATAVIERLCEDQLQKGNTYQFSSTQIFRRNQEQSLTEKHSDTHTKHSEENDEQVKFI